MKSYYVYILTNYKSSVFYIGITNDLKRRIWEHKNKLNINSFTTKYRLYKLVWYEEFGNPEDAIRVEKKIKGWKREKKICLIRTKNAKFVDLYTLC
ncbi:GIY-YIG nuclease family protein [Patescibacteria group bacterium]|nr:GIY-YIG nuclease family protein [Patescibacteria group bacterium]MCG2702018.1 GIY-YIG nuclease family protein [Candidatus Parcubacteria bacterium]MBU4265538.1 GIY-YIG nuclease family protein [Patescibacteria group bacterium]MBU4389867.1 GIY-YIG nuclease family protein [Patescibacteria group bacterium]MBU4397260.1 GIY-YIG nuclease family protein [Patescibacteria group bacterium]